MLFDADDGNPTQAKVTTRDYERTPNLYGYLTATLRPTSALSFVLSGTYTGSMNVPHTAYEGVGDLNLQANELDAQGHFDVVRDGTRYRGQNAGSAYLYKAKPFVDLDFRVSYAFSLTSLVKLTLDAGVQNFLNAYQKDTDMGPGRASDYIYGPNRPRRLYLSATFDI